MNRNYYDVVIVGAGSAGAYFAYRLAKLGNSVLVIEKDKEEDVSARLDLIHYPFDEYEKNGITPPSKDSKEFYHEFLHCKNYSALNTVEKNKSLHIYAVSLPLMNKRLRDMSIGLDVTFEYQASFNKLVYDNNNQIKGVIYNKLQKEYEVETLLVSDCSGISSVVRKQVESKYMENIRIDEENSFFVVLKCVIFDDPNNKVIESASWPYFKCWKGPFSKEGGGILGVGAAHSFEYAKKMQDYFESKIPIPPYTVDHYEYGVVPYKRFPYSFVSDHFVAMGDCACNVNPISGEGLAYQFNFVDFTIDVFDKAIKNKNTSVDSLWDVNTIFYNKMGADVNFIRSITSCFMAFNEKENEYLFKKGIFFKDERDKVNNPIIELFKGALTFKIRWKVFFKFFSQVIKANKLKKMYLNYPTNPSDFDSFKSKASKMWEKVGKISDYDIKL